MKGFEPNPRVKLLVVKEFKIVTLSFLKLYKFEDLKFENSVTIFFLLPV